MNRNVPLQVCWSKSPWRSRGSTEAKDRWESFVCVCWCMHMKKCALVTGSVDMYVCVFLGNRGHSMGSLKESWEIREGLVSWTLRHMFSLYCPPPSFLSLNYKCPPTLGSGEPWTEGGMRGFHLLFISTGSGNTPHCQPNPLSLHLVPWQRGGGGGAAVTRYRAPDVPQMRGEDDRVSPRRSYGCRLMKTEWGGVGWM